MIGGSQSFFNLQETLLRDSKNGQRIGEAGGIISAITQINSSSITASPQNPIYSNSLSICQIISCYFQQLLSYLLSS